MGRSRASLSQPSRLTDIGAPRVFVVRPEAEQLSPQERPREQALRRRLRWLWLGL